MAEKDLLVEMGKRLYRQRKRMRLTQEETAELLEISTTFYGEIERGKRKLSIEKILLAYERMNMDPTYLLTGERKDDQVLLKIFNQCPCEKQPELEKLLEQMVRLCR